MSEKIEHKLLLKGTRVRYMGIEATVIRGNEPDADWYEGCHPLVTIRYDRRRAGWGWSQVQEVFANACTVI